jgi:peptidoglycan/xylan/chitin deacetylase (PgdA/CDA1 family)
MGPWSRCLSILIYHRVIPEPDPLLPDEICAREFDWHLAVLGRWFRVLDLPEAMARLRDGSLPARAACVTFDDGYADNVSAALPLLRKHGMTATFFLATGWLAGGRMWNDTVIETVRRAPARVLDARPAGLGMLDIGAPEQRRGAIERLLARLKYLPMEERQRRADELASAAGCDLPSDLMMSADGVRELHRSGMRIGAHTVNHPILAKLDRPRARREIEESRARLEAITGAPVRLFAYPNGRPGVDYLREHVDLVKDLGFDAAVTTARGVARSASDPLQLPRFTPWDRTRAKFALRLMHNRLSAAAETV